MLPTGTLTCYDLLMISINHLHYVQSIEVSAPPGNVVGIVQQEWTLCIPSFKINNPSGDTILRIEGPFCTFSICGDVEFKVLSADGNTQVGKISKHWTGLVREAATDADNFGITFPMDLDVRMKAVMLGACFLIVRLGIDHWELSINTFFF